MRFDLKVPFAEKDAAKKLGARWDAANKLWYVQDKADMSAFAKWAPTPREAASPAARLVKPAAAPALSAGPSRIGKLFRPQALSCACLPWEDCARCRTDEPASR